MRLALDYVDAGGRLAYLGGNGFYWRIATSAVIPNVVEVRRAEGGIRAWAAEPGEYYHALDGAYGGLWRRNGPATKALRGRVLSPGPVRGLLLPSFACCGGRPRC